VAWLAGLGAPWALLIQNLAPHWTVNPQYGFGWLVPVLAAWLAWERWPTRPPPQPGPPGVARTVGLAAALALAPTWLLAQPNPDWRFIGWALALEVIVVTLALVHLAGGARWTRHFAFAVCFILTAVPWPTAVENAVIQNLMTAVAAVTVEVMNLLGIPALRHGNVIEVGRGLVGIDEACSGVRSLQAALMAAWFTGEFFRLGLTSRLGMLVASAATAFALNVVRSCLLTTVGARGGTEALARWHDPAGFIILAVCTVVVWWLGRRLAPTPLPARSRLEAPAPRPVPGFYFVLLGGWCVAVVAATELWYRAHESRIQPPWHFAWPDAQPGFADLPIAPDSATMLRFDAGRGGRWQERDGHTWLAFSLEWKTGARHATILARMHRPETCLPATGYRLIATHGPVELDAGGVRLPFQRFTFAEREDGEPVQVFFCVWERFAASHPPVPGNALENLPRLAAAVEGRRNRGQQALEFALLGYSTVTEAEAALRARLPDLIAWPPPQARP
jgi:exosortase